MAATPNVENLSLFRAQIKWMEQGESSYRDVGEIAAFSTNMEVDTLPYKTKRQGTRLTVREIPLEKRLNVTLTMNEMDAENMQMALMADSAGSPAVMTIGTKSEVRGALRVVGTTVYGIRYQVDLYDVILVPSGELGWVSDEDWAAIEMTGRVMADTTTGSFGDVQEIVTEIAMGSPPV